MPCTVHVLGKDDFFFIKKTKLVHAPTGKIPNIIVHFLFICTRDETFGIDNLFALSLT